MTGRWFLPLPDDMDIDDLVPHIIERNVERFERLGLTPSPSRMRPRRMCSVPGSVVLEVPSLLLREHDDSASSVGKPFEH